MQNEQVIDDCHVAAYDDPRSSGRMQKLMNVFREMFISIPSVGNINGTWNARGVSRRGAWKQLLEGGKTK